MDVEKDINNITRSLADLTGFDIRVRKLESNNKGAMDGLA